ncbi:helix-turn-helix domain-containing protein [bacterium]|nr:helix-turn-helix domain-containing protein [bacterium]
MHSAEDAQRFGRTMREYRRRAGLTQQQLADRAEIDRATVSLIENGREEPRADTVRRLATVLGVNPADFWRDPPSRGQQPETPSAQSGDSFTAHESEGVHYESLSTSRPHPGLTELLEDERSRLMLAITPEEEEMLRSIRTRRDAPLGKDFFIDVLVSYRRNRT